MFLVVLLFILEGIIINSHLQLADIIVLSDTSYILLIIFNSMIFIIFSRQSFYRDEKLLYQYYLMGYLFRLILMFWSAYFSDVFTLPNSGADEFTYYYNAMSYIVKGTSVSGYSFIYSLEAKVFGLSKLYGQYFNVLISMYGTLVIKRAMNYMDINYRYKKYGFMLACFLPNLAILSSLLLRESLITTLLALSIYSLIKWWYGNKNINALLAISYSLIATWLHSGVFVCTIGILIIIFASRRTSTGRSFHIISIRGIVATAIIMIISVSTVMSSDSNFFGYFKRISSAEDVASVSEAYEDGESSYNANITEDTSLKGLVINSPSRAFYFILSPLPWDWRGFNDAIAFAFNAVFYVYTIIIGIKALMNTKGKNRSLIKALLFIAILTTLMFGWGVSNSGTALRHRDKFVAIYILIFVLSKESLGYRNIRQKEYNDYEHRYQYNYTNI